MSNLSRQYQEILEKEKKLVSQIWNKLKDIPPLQIPFSDFSTLFVELKIEHRDLGLKEIITFEDIRAVISSKEGGSYDVDLKISKNYPSVREASTGLRLIIIDKLAEYFNIKE